MIEEPQPPSRDYLIALLAEANGMVIEWLDTGKKPMTQQQKDNWMKHKEFVRSEIQRVKRLI